MEVIWVLIGGLLGYVLRMMQENDDEPTPPSDEATPPSGPPINPFPPQPTDNA